MSNNKDSLENIYLWDYFLLNYKVKEEINLLDAYKKEELVNKLVIQVKQSDYKKYFVVDEISEIYNLPEIHEYINSYSYYLLYASTLLINYLELKEFTESVYRLIREKYNKFIDKDYLIKISTSTLLVLQKKIV
ncbi:hypothetical protein Glove_99g385 [Diversispora epigaea]|uniref:Uncharacterized protein n=1 Tax=Diversispora epigaea TaxID=1348612 RepID=A0A397JDN8_9GLOM|nr:hypothetical protein Glove_99g385 [Diversispora epigaea]